MSSFTPNCIICREDLILHRFSLRDSFLEDTEESHHGFAVVELKRILPKVNPEEGPKHILYCGVMETLPTFHI